ncbi:MAG: bifunctional nuclease family protein [Akkermansiaceae bacterium]|nr:bifunctional nuclease family protein [Akkermansiaceae bacterium]
MQVTLARITALVGNTYHARMHLAREDDPTGPTFDVDARPSDAINMAVRFEAPILVSRCSTHLLVPLCKHAM